MQQTKLDGSVTVTELEEKKLLAQGLDDAGDETQTYFLLRKNLPKVILKPLLAAVVDEQKFHYDLHQPFRNFIRDFGLPMVCERACDVAPLTTQWLWPGRIPLGRFTVLAAEQRHVASRVACDLAARVSARRGWPDGMPDQDQAKLAVDGVPGDGAARAAKDPPPVESAVPESEQIRQQARVLFVSSRAEIPRTVVPRLTQARADLARVLCVSGILSRPVEDEVRCVENVTFPDSFDSLCGAIEALPALRLVVIDPIEEFLESSGGGRAFIPSAAAIDGLEEMARELNVAILGIAGLCRGSARPGALPPLKHRILATHARVVLGIVRERGEPGRYVLAPLSRVSEETGNWLPLQVDGGSLTWDPEPIPEPADELRPAARKSNEGTQWLSLEEAAALLQRFLAGGSRLATEVRHMAEALGLSRARLRRVKEELGIQSDRLEYHGPVFWSLPGQSHAGSDTARITGGERASQADSREICCDARLEKSSSH